MSRVGKKPIKIPSGVEVNLSGDTIKVKGPKGELSEKIHPKVKVEKKDDIISVSVNNPEDKGEKSLWGLFGSLISNMVEGVTTGYEKKLEINGVGYKAALSGSKLVLHIGFSHPVEYLLPKGITAEIDKNIITIKGFDKYLVGQVAAEIRGKKKPEPYKGKGIKYLDEVLRRKSGKTAAKGAE